MNPRAMAHGGLLVAVVGGFLPSPVRADPAGRQAQDNAAAAAAAQARQRTGGRVLTVRDPTLPDNGGYSVRVLTPDGRVRMIEVEGPPGK